MPIPPRALRFLLCFPALASAADKVTYDDHVFPLFQRSCLNCHNPDKTKGGLDLSTYGGAMKGGSGGKIAEPGDATSKILAVCMQTVEPKMPPEGDKLGADQIELLKGWIDGGLLENKNSSAKKPSKPKFETALKSDPAAKPDGPPPMPEHLLLEPVVTTARASAVHALAASPWAPLLAVTGQHQILLHDSGTLELVGILPFPGGDPLSLAFTPDGRHLIAGGGVPGKSGVTVTYEVRSGERLLTAAKEFDSVLAADIRPGFDVVATGGPSKLLKLWDTRSGQPVASIKKHTDWITALDISPDGILVASGDRNGGVWVWEAASGNEFHTLRAHQAGISALAFRADSNLLATASEDGTIRYWEMNGGSEVRKNDAHPGGVTAFAFARDGSAVSAGRDRKVRLWKPDFSPARELAKDLPGLPVAVALTADGSRAFAADHLGVIRAWQTSDGKPAGEFTNNPPAIATRIASLSDALRAQPEPLAAAERAAEEAARKLNEAKDAVETATKAAKQARAIHEAAKHGESEMRAKLEEIRRQLGPRRDRLDQLNRDLTALRQDLEGKRQTQAALPEAERQPDTLKLQEERVRALSMEVATLQQETGGLAAEEQTLPAAIEGAARATVAAADRIQPADDAIGPKREAVAPAEKAVAEAKAAVETAKGSLAGLQASEKRWKAAAINARAIATREQAERLTTENEDRLANFAAAEQALDAPLTALNAKRAEREAFAARCQEPSSAADPVIREEMAATLAALDRRVAALAGAAEAAALQVSRLRGELDGAAAPLHDTAREAERLRDGYLSALK